jgi:hypothetical protein
MVKTVVFITVLVVLGHIFNKVKSKTKQMTKKERKQAVLAVATQLCAIDNRVTTKEIKLNLHKIFPTEFWTTYSTNGVDGVSDLFHELVNEGTFVSVANNGTFQTYAHSQLPIRSRQSMPVIQGENAPARLKVISAKQTAGIVNALQTASASAPVAKATPKKAAKPALPKIPKGTKAISKKKALDLIQNNKGRFFTATFVKKTDGSVRVMNAQYLPGQTISGDTVKVKDAALCRSNPGNCIRSFDLSTVHQIKIGGNLYKIK